jgi:hypothetical protein
MSLSVCSRKSAPGVGTQQLLRAAYEAHIPAVAAIARKMLETSGRRPAAAAPTHCALVIRKVYQKRFAGVARCA